MNKAGFWRRFVAVFIDGILLAPFSYLSLIAAGNSYAGFPLQIIYETILISQWGGYTVGKKVMGIRVVTTGGEQLDWVKSFIRAVSKILSALALLIGYLWMLWDEKKQTWHDMIADTFVVEA